MIRRRRSSPTTTSQWDVVLPILFPHGLDHSALAQIDEVVNGQAPSSGLVRRVLGALDQQRFPSAVTVRWSDGDLEVIDIGGARLALDRADASVSIQIAAGEYEPHVVAMLRAHLTPGATFVDVGANVGYHTVIAAGVVGPTGRVIAVEANPENARLLKRSVTLNGFEHVDVLPIALAASWGSLEFGSHIGSNGGFVDSGADHRAEGRATIVPTMPLDALELGALDVIKIDVEGAEALVLDGALTTIQRCRPTMIVEFSMEMTSRVAERDPRAHLGRIEELGYRIAIIDRATARPVEVASADALLDAWGSELRIEDLLLTPV